MALAYLYCSSRFQRTFTRDRIKTHNNRLKTKTTTSLPQPSHGEGGVRTCTIIALPLNKSQTFSPEPKYHYCTTQHDRTNHFIAMRGFSIRQRAFSGATLFNARSYEDGRVFIRRARHILTHRRTHLACTTDSLPTQLLPRTPSQQLRGYTGQWLMMTAACMIMIINPGPPFPSGACAPRKIQISKLLSIT